MIYFESTDIFYSIIFAFLFGIITGIAYRSVYSLGTGIILLFRAFSLLFRDIKLKSILAFNVKKKSADFKVLKHLFDFIFFFTTGILYICLTYLTLDGELRVYVLIISALGFFISRNTLGAALEKIVLMCIELINTAWASILFILFLPSRVIIHKLLIPLVSLLCIGFMNHRSKILLKRKCIKAEYLDIK